MEFYIEKVYFNMKSCFLQNVFKRPKRLKNVYFVQFQRNKMYIVFIFLFFNQNTEINRK